MKKIIKTIILGICSCIIFCSCQKGDAGPQGAEGPKGEQGIRGDDGNTILSGNGAPSTSLGKAGDFYIDLHTDLLYGPKSGSGWGSGINLKGDKGDTGNPGAAGKNGSTILSGNGAPAPGSGAVGDYYFDKTNSLFYGPKVSGGWGTPVSLKGSKGDKGDPGTANVIYSDWFTPDRYVKDTLYGIWRFNYDKPVAEITQDIIDKGSVLVYGKLLGYNPVVWPVSQVAQMPIQLTYVQGAEMTDTWSALITKGNIKIRFINDRNYYTVISSVHQFRYVIIPGSVKTTSAAVNFNDYNAVKAVFQMND